MRFARLNNERASMPARYLNVAGMPGRSSMLQFENADMCRSDESDRATALAF